MDQIQEVINSARLTGYPKGLKSESGNGKRISDHAACQADYVWLEMTKAYGRKFVDDMGDAPNSAWLDLMSDLSRKEVDRGLQRTRGDDKFRDWPPSLFAFENLCKPTAEDMGLPDRQTAYQIAIGNHPQKHKAVAWTLRKMGNAAWNVKHSAEHISRGVWDSAYQKHAVDWMADGNIIPETKRDNPSKFRREKTQKDRDTHAMFMKEFRADWPPH